MATQTGGRLVRLVFSALVMVMSMFVLSASAQSRRNGGTGITVFTNPDFSGDSVTFRSDTPDLRGYSLNDKISSLEITDGASWEVCQDINYANRCQVFSGSVSNLRSMGWNDRISSLRRVSDGRRQGGIFTPNGSNRAMGLVLYDRPNFRGSSTLVNRDSAVGLGNNLGSAQVRGGAWQLCDRTGRCATVTQDVADLSRLGLRGRITSARLVNGVQNNATYGRDPRYGRFWGR
jgi:hypothetical protein